MNLHTFLHTPGFRLLLAALVITVLVATCDKAKEKQTPQNQANVPTSQDAVRNAANEGNLNAQLRLGNQAYQQRRYTEALTWYTAASEQGDPNAQASLAYMYAYGLGTEQDFEKARSFAEAAISGGNEFAQQIIAQILPQLAGRVE